MKLITALIFIVAVASAADRPPDLTGMDAKTFKAHLGQVVSLRGILAVGMQGECLRGATPKSVSFYIVPDLSQSGVFTTPPKWDRLFGHEVRVSGLLKFRSFDRSQAKPSDQMPPDFYYMDHQRVEIQSLDSK